MELLAYKRTHLLTLVHTHVHVPIYVYNVLIYTIIAAAAGGGSSSDWLVGGGVPLRPSEDPRYFNPDVVPQGVGVDELRLRMQQQQAAQQRGMFVSSVHISI
jgi:hypothetical protein